MKKVALVIGHKSNSPGACNKNHGMCEFFFNEDLVERVAAELKKGWFFRKVDPVIIYRDTYKGLPDKINTENPDFIVSFHCNAFNRLTTGTEVLYYHTSSKGKLIAGTLLNHLLNALKLPNRGIKGKTAEDRGGYLLKHTVAPCIISEPFFIDNDGDYERAEENLDKLVKAYVDAIKEMAVAV